MFLGGLVIVALSACASDGDTSDNSQGTVDTAVSDEPSSAAAPSVDVVADATAFWEAVAARDVDTAASYVDPELIESGAKLLFGRAGTFHGQFDWYEAVDWKFVLDECVEGSLPMAASCTGSVSNPWSDAVGESPVLAKHSLHFGDDGIRRVLNVSFGQQWVSEVYGPFRAWVEDNHPDDALVMFGYGDVNEEVLELYATNTARFAEAEENADVSE